MKTRIFDICVCIAFIISINTLNAQNKGLYAINNDYTITINGSSNLHDWNETINKASGRSIITTNANGSINLDSLCIRMDARSINSSEGKVMVNKTCDALKASRYPFIIFSILSPLKMIATGKAEIAVNTLGELTIAGVTRHVNIEGKIYTNDARKFIFEGTLPIQMSDYNIIPPTALLGLLKVKNFITVHYRTSFEIKS